MKIGLEWMYFVWTVLLPPTKARMLRNLFFLMEYEGLGDDVRFDTGFSTSEWYCGVVGLAALDGKINAMGTGHVMLAHAYREAGTWHLRGEFRTRGRHPEDWKMNMLCADLVLVAEENPIADRPMLSKRFVDPLGTSPYDIGVSKEDWVCGLTGVEIYDADIDEFGGSFQRIIEAYLYEGETNWMAKLDFRTNVKRG